MVIVTRVSRAFSCASATTTSSSTSAGAGASAGLRLVGDGMLAAIFYRVATQWPNSQACVSLARAAPTRRNCCTKHDCHSLCFCKTHTTYTTHSATNTSTTTTPPQASITCTKGSAQWTESAVSSPPPSVPRHITQATQYKNNFQACMQSLGSKLSHSPPGYLLPGRLNQSRNAPAPKADDSAQQPGSRFSGEPHTCTSKAKLHLNSNVVSSPPSWAPHFRLNHDTECLHMQHALPNTTGNIHFAST